MKKYVLAPGMVIAFAIALYSCGGRQDRAPASVDSTAVEEIPVLADSAEYLEDTTAADTAAGVHGGPRPSGPRPRR